MVKQIEGMGAITYFLGLNCTKRICIDRSAHAKFETAIGCLISCSVAYISSCKLIPFSPFSFFFFFLRPIKNCLSNLIILNRLKFALVHLGAELLIERS